MHIRIAWSTGQIVGELNGSPGANKLAAALPCTARANTWGQEVYFDLPADIALEKNATDVVEPGTICYWVQGSSLALPFGPTPASRERECRLVTAVTTLGRIEGNPKQLGQIKAGELVTVSLVEE